LRFTSFYGITLDVKPSLLFAPLLVFALNTYAADDRVKIDNEHARVLVVSSPSGAKSELHEHKMNRVMIYLDPGKMTLTDTKGEVETLNFKAGEALWSPATKLPHISLNQSEKAVRIVEIELKSQPGPQTGAKPRAIDWEKLDPKHYKVEFDNDQVRVIRVHYGPHEKGVLHEHTVDYLVAFLTECHLKITVPGGESKTANKSPGDVIAGVPTKHLEENLSDSPLELVLVEFKK
jgi:quercetin dioxygenase-like cupin family protein